MLVAWLLCVSKTAIVVNMDVKKARKTINLSELSCFSRESSERFSLFLVVSEGRAVYRFVGGCGQIDGPIRSG